MTDREFPPIEVIKEDVTEPSRKLDWTFREVKGMEVYRSVEDFKAGKPVKDDLKDGEEVIVNAMFYWCRARVVGDICESGDFIFPLERCEDERDCWVTTAVINKKCMGVLAMALKDKK